MISLKSLIPKSLPIRRQNFLKPRSYHISSCKFRCMDGIFKDREQALENYSVRQHEEKLIQQLKDEIKIKLRESRLASPKKDTTQEEFQQELSHIKEVLEDAYKTIEDINKKYRVKTN